MTTKRNAEFLEKKIKQCLANAKRQRHKMNAARHPRIDVRVHPEYWEQCARDYGNELINYINKIINQ